MKSMTFGHRLPSRDEKASEWYKNSALTSPKPISVRVNRIITNPSFDNQEMFSPESRNVFKLNQKIIQVKQKSKFEIFIQHFIIHDHHK